MLHSAITIIMIMTTTRIGILLKLFVFVSIGFDLLVLMSFFRMKFKKFFNLNFPEASIHVPVIVPILYSAYLIFMLITPIIKDQDVKLLIPLCVIALTGLLHFLFVRKKVGDGFNFFLHLKHFCVTSWILNTVNIVEIFDKLKSRKHLSCIFFCLCIEGSLKNKINKLLLNY